MLRVDNLDVQVSDTGSKLVVDGATFTVHSAEVLGIAGIEGNGQFELCEAILGLCPTVGGMVELNGVDLTHLSVHHRRELGISYIPFDRHREGLLLEAPLWENTMLGRDETEGLSNGPFVSASGARRDCEKVVQRFGVRTPGNRRSCVRVVGRQPAEARRWPRALQRDRRPAGCPPDTRRRRRRAGRDLGRAACRARPAGSACC